MSKNKHTIPILVSIIILFMVTSGIAFYRLEYSNNDIIKNNLLQFNAGYLSNLYLNKDPDIVNRPYYGNQDASINIIAYLDIDSDASRFFIEEIFPKLKQDYINTGEAKYYHKYYLTIDDIEQKNTNFRYAATLSCISAINNDRYYDFYFDLFSNQGISQLPKLLEKHGIPVNDYNDCIAQNNFHELYEDALEVQNFGIVGLNQRFYIGLADMDSTIVDGVPKYDSFKKKIREFGIQVGN